MKTPAWNCTNEEFDLYYDFNTNFDNLLPYYMSCSGVKNKFLNNNTKYKSVYRAQMKTLYLDGDLDKPRMKKMIQWLKVDHETKLRKRDLKNHNDQGIIMDMKDKENDRLDRELQEAKLLIMNLQKENHRLKIKVEGLEDKLSLKKEPIIQQTIIEYRESDEVAESIKDPYAMANDCIVEDSDDDIF
jgi:superfamily II DNA helicase RecQ